MPIISEVPDKETLTLNIRKQLSIPDDALVCGFHQRNDPSITSLMSLEAFKHCLNVSLEKRVYFILMGGSDIHRKYVEGNKIENVRFLDHSGSTEAVHSFLKALDIYCHARKDGETFGLAIAEALYHGLPVISHRAPALGQIETIGPAGKVVSNVEEYKDFLTLLLTSQEERDKYSKIAFDRYVKKFSVESSMNEIDKIIEAILNTKEKEDADFWEDLWE